MEPIDNGVQENAITVTTKQEEFITCGAPLQSHVASLLSIIGTTLGCHDSYKALIEVADWVKKENKLPDYKSQGLVDILILTSMAVTGPVQ